MKKRGCIITIIILALLLSYPIIYLYINLVYFNISSGVHIIKAKIGKNEKLVFENIMKNDIIEIDSIYRTIHTYQSGNNYYDLYYLCDIDKEFIKNNKIKLDEIIYKSAIELYNNPDLKKYKFKYICITIKNKKSMNYGYIGQCYNIIEDGIVRLDN